MKSFILNFAIYLLISIPFVASSQGSDKPGENIMASEDLEMLIGEWEGTLMYLDYSSGEPFEMPANLEIEWGKNKYELQLHNIFPNEPKANSKSTFTISEDGRMIDGKPLFSRKINSDSETEFIVEYPGRDGNENKEATIRQIYILGSSSFLIRKEVKFSDQDEWIKRNEFSYQKK